MNARIILPTKPKTHDPITKLKTQTKSNSFDASITLVSTKFLDLREILTRLKTITLLSLLALLNSCVEPVEESQNLLTGNAVPPDREEFNLSFGFGEVGEVETYELRFEETSTWEVRSEKSIAEVEIAHGNGGVVPSITVCNGDSKQSERIVFKRNEIYTLFVTDNQSMVVNRFLVNFKKLSPTTAAEDFPIDRVRAEVISREPAPKGIFYEKTNTLFLFSLYKIRSFRFDRSTMECTENQSLSIPVDEVVSMAVDETNERLYVLGKSKKANYTYEYPLFCYDILDGGRLRLEREISSIAEFMGNSSSEYVVIKSMCIDAKGDFLYLSMDNSQMSWISNDVMLILDLRETEFVSHLKQENFIMLLQKMQVGPDNQYWWGLTEGGKLYRKDISDGLLSSDHETYGMFYSVTYDFDTGQDEVILCQSMPEYSTGRILLYQVEPWKKLDEQQIHLGTDDYTIARSEANAYVSFTHEDQKTWIQIFDGENEPVGALSRQFRGADPLNSPINGMQYSPKHSLLFVFCEAGAFVVGHGETVYDEEL
jgi:hypothetical protein